jgi:RNA polymerase sigma factor (sigma-70 family)
MNADPRTAPDAADPTPTPGPGAAADPLDTLLVRLTRGETDAAVEVFLTFEPVLRAMVRRWLTPRLRVKFDSMDVVQSVWADLLDGFDAARWRFSDREHLRAYLARVTYNHFVNNCRRHGRALERERPLAPSPGGPSGPLAIPSCQPRPSELAQAGELWDLLNGLCPPAHRELLRLKRQGFPLAEIAARTGLHESSVRRILYDLARRLAAARGMSSPADDTAD